jgi:hypothetical protein
MRLMAAGFLRYRAASKTRRRRAGLCQEPAFTRAPRRGRILGFCGSPADPAQGRSYPGVLESHPSLSLLIATIAFC